MDAYDAVVIGAGPNGLAAAIVLARAGLSVQVVEGSATPGGGARSDERTLPGFVHDVCSAIHPTAVASPFLRTLRLEQYGLRWIHPPAPLAHPLDDGSAAVLTRSLDAMAETLGDEDGAAYRQWLEPLVENADALYGELLGPLALVPRHPVLLARFGLTGMRSAVGLARELFRGPRAQALVAGGAAHSFLPLESAFTAAFAMVLSIAGHAFGWPCAEGGSRAVIDALVMCLRSHGGELVVNHRVRAMSDLPAARAYLFDTPPRALVEIAGNRLPRSFRARLLRFRHGPGVFKVDWALDGPIPWKSRDCARAATVHVGGTLDQIAEGEAKVARGEHSAAPFVLVAQQSLFDPTRAPPGRHTGWAYCHVPAGSSRDMTEVIERQIERFAPGFRDRILARATMGCADFERYNPNYVGGDISGGANDVTQLFTRPIVARSPYATPAHDLFLCSASTPPGAGVHGMCGYHAAQVVLARVFGGPPATLDLALVSPAGASPHSLTVAS